jgi:hypothetical protein
VAERKRKQWPMVMEINEEVCEKGINNKDKRRNSDRE